MTTTRTVRTSEAGTVPVTFDDSGEGRPVLLLHGGGGPQTVSAFGERLVAAGGVRVIVPTHPGFAGTPRPDELATVGGLAALYDALVAELGLSDVAVVGNSLGGWIAAETAILGSPRVTGSVLIDAVGLEVAGHPVVDFFALPLEKIANYSYRQLQLLRPGPVPDRPHGAAP
ncbi:MULTISPECIES: alpha/beta fold hydrolase [unclassified Pseudofrankia]|uniref:alpha/beta fold hydrolase n=1 Tax=unclassified Pseudofrankia TaxID=2994372 RepID=UPI0008DB166D|nr:MULTISPECIES: alpha/beta hydrolase [unclassified Pseudofrankia]MDT3441996.1 alpha/beta hydrolase [Pseudofrankia sp. BMG5.37]OHV44617.1 hypothetical protein BCD48_25600 [Pseudofrankia sp. BMG5.36]